MISTTRREFLAKTSLVVAGAHLYGLYPKEARASSLGGSVTGNDLISESLGPTDLQVLATVAVDAARSAGASYADIRVGEWQRLEISQGTPGEVDAETRLDATFTYGLRVIVDGAWAFVHGSIPSVDTMQRSAQEAVAMAKSYSRLVKQPVELAPTAPVTGEWETPIEIDPFSISIHDQTAMLGAFAQAAGRVQDGGLAFGLVLAWIRETRVFASSDGSLITQTLRKSQPYLRAMGDKGMGPPYESGVRLAIPELLDRSVGYESVTNPALQDEIKRVTEEAVYLASLPRRAFDVGRYPVVFDGDTLGPVFLHTIGHALETDRVLGYEADAGGTSFLSPPEELLGTQIVNPLLSVTGSRALPSSSAVKWDDEGVEARTFPMIDKGILVNYPTSRQTASALQDWNKRQGNPVGSTGCAVAPSAGNTVQVRAPHLTIAPGNGSASLEDLCKGINKGILVRQARWLSTQQHLASASLTDSAIMLEIEKGRIVRRVYGNGLQFGTSTFWKSLLGLGDPNTVRYSALEAPKGQPWRYAAQSVTAPAGLVKEVNVVNLKISL